MSSWVVTDDTPTATVVWMAAEQIGKTQNHEQLQKICDYLVNKHWFQTAGDLRSARQEATEWQALEVPGRLKLAIQQVLDRSTPHHESVSNYGYEEYYAAVCPSLEPGSAATTQNWTESYVSAEGADQTTTNYYYSRDYGYSSTDATAAQYGYDQADYTATDNPPSYDESSSASYENYYSGGSNYDSGEAATTLLSLHGSMEQSQVDESDVVEAHAVEAEVAEECEESEITPDESSYVVELGEPTQRDASDTSGTWSCGQCTYLNPMTSSFCEMCIGHISLSSDVKTTAGTSVSASLLIPAKSMVDVAMNSPKTESPVNTFTVQSSQPSVTCMMSPKGSLYPPSAPDFEGSEDEPVDASPLPPPPLYPGTSSCGNVDFLALAFSGSSAPKTQAPNRSSPTGKCCQMRREEATTEYTF
ncbi:hypothetical protein JG687_00005116 [Phytophthora cactorum]|uniref:RanBP2-type domain-containing protein n=1 Tax=Phytophthora cactorum TaxID=29920 RepID=A0A329SYC3_9STRA|nr:hypothetical protein Pcac1_g15461 [Phytophthora cactorum]KAG2838774.1 hypothetical protein PC112_g4358 [Phytophthora cactorum]KAG2840753.1 hypothetical protein PC111_g3345 [Phytophthora cactorum]KAG2864783.1 hypothetical protein PC113_g4251 [Phytophthora cactorum]KAG2923834.1 hypothetical protein PC114_g4668 [Phytophthora cactorum]